MFSSCTGFASFALPHALVAVVGKISDLVRLFAFFREGRALWEWSRSCAPKSREMSYWKRGTSEVASLLAEEPCRGAWPESRQVERRQAGCLSPCSSQLLCFSCLQLSHKAIINLSLLISPSWL